MSAPSSCAAHTSIKVPHAVSAPCRCLSDCLTCTSASLPAKSATHSCSSATRTSTACLLCLQASLLQQSPLQPDLLFVCAAAVGACVVAIATAQAAVASCGLQASCPPAAQAVASASTSHIGMDAC